MIAKSMPEALLHYYIVKFVDANAKLNETKIVANGKTYTADIAFLFDGTHYDLEFDSLERHSNELIRKSDLLRDEIFKNKGYKIIRMRNYTKTKKMEDMPGCINIGMPLNFIGAKGNFPLWQIEETTLGLHQLMEVIGVKYYDIDIVRDYNRVLDLYFPGRGLKRIIGGSADFSNQPTEKMVREANSWNQIIGKVVESEHNKIAEKLIENGKMTLEEISNVVEIPLERLMLLSTTKKGKH